MAKRKPIKLKYGKFKELVKISGANRITVWRALNGTPTARKKTR